MSLYLWRSQVWSVWKTPFPTAHPAKRKIVSGNEAETRLKEPRSWLNFPLEVPQSWGWLNIPVHRKKCPIIYTPLNLELRESAYDFTRDLTVRNSQYTTGGRPSALRTGFIAISTHSFWWANLLFYQLKSQCMIPADCSISPFFI